MRPIFVFLIFLSIAWSCKNNSHKNQTGSIPDQQPTDYINGCLEKNTPGQKLPDQWSQWGDLQATVVKDSTLPKSGKYSVRIERGNKTGQSPLGCLGQSLSATYQPKKIELKAWMKYSSVTNGCISLFLRIDGRDSLLAYADMQTQKIEGTSDWKLFSLSVDYPEGAQSISFGAFNSGSGRLWVDDFQLFLDDKDYNQLQTAYYQKPPVTDEEKIAFVNNISAITPLPANQKAAKEYALWLCEKFSKAPANEIEAHPSAKVFPGEVPASAQRITRKIQFRHTPVPQSVRHITDNLYASGKDNETMYSTGLYAAPGEKITIRIPDQLKGKISLQIGCHTDILNSEWAPSAKGSWRRMPNIIRKDRLEQNINEAASAFGGLIYLTCSPYAEACTGEVIIKNAVAAPHFVLGKTTAKEWWDMLNSTSAPWGELEGNDIIITCTTKALKEITNPDKQTRIWDNVVNACYDLAQIPTPFFRKQRIVTDVQITAGYLHSGYPIMGTHCPSLNMTCEDIITKGEKILRPHSYSSSTGWGFFHEIGHNMQNFKDWVFDGSTEVSVNFFSLYILDHLIGGREYAHESITGVKKQNMMKKYFANGARFSDWQKDPFLGLIMFQQLQADFGWETFKKVFRRFHEQNARNGNPVYTNQEKIDHFILYFSDATQRNLIPFFRTWGLPVSEAYASHLKQYPEWMPYHFPPQ